MAEVDPYTDVDLAGLDGDPAPEPDPDPALTNALWPHDTIPVFVDGDDGGSDMRNDTHAEVMPHELRLQQVWGDVQMPFLYEFVKHATYTRRRVIAAPRRNVVALVPNRRWDQRPLSLLAELGKQNPEARFLFLGGTVDEETEEDLGIIDPERMRGFFLRETSASGRIDGSPHVGRSFKGTSASATIDAQAQEGAEFAAMHDADVVVIVAPLEITARFAAIVAAGMNCMDRADSSRSVERRRIAMLPWGEWRELVTCGATAGGLAFGSPQATQPRLAEERFGDECGSLWYEAVLERRALAPVECCTFFSLLIAPRPRAT